MRCPLSLPNRVPEQTSGHVRLSVPAEAGSLAVVRTVAAAAGARAALTLDDLDDLTIATEEAVLALIGFGASQVEVRADIGDARVAVSVSSEGPRAGWPPADLSDGLAWKVLTGLATEVRLGPDGGAPAISFTKGRVGEEAPA